MPDPDPIITVEREPDPMARLAPLYNNPAFWLGVQALHDPHERSHADAVRLGALALGRGDITGSSEFRRWLGR